MKLPQRILVLTSLVVAALLSGCTRGASLTVVNRSTAELTNVVATGTGFTQQVGSIPAGTERHITIQPTSESGLQLDFDANGKHFKTAPQGYFEASVSKVTATINLDFTVTVDAK